MHRPGKCAPSSMCRSSGAGAVSSSRINLLRYLHCPHATGPMQWARGDVGPPPRAPGPLCRMGIWCPMGILSPSRVCRNSVARVFRIPTHGSGKSHIYQSRSYSVIRPRAVTRGRTAGPLCRLCPMPQIDVPPFLDKGGKHR